MFWLKVLAVGVVYGAEYENCILHRKFVWLLVCSLLYQGDGVVQQADSCMSNRSKIKHTNQWCVLLTQRYVYNSTFFINFIWYLYDSIKQIKNKTCISMFRFTDSKFWLRFNMFLVISYGTCMTQSNRSELKHTYQSFVLLTQRFDYNSTCFW